MKTHHLIPLLITALISSSLNPVGAAFSETDTAVVCFSRERLGLFVQIEAAATAWPGANVNVTIHTTATQANVHIRHIQVSVSSMEENRSRTLLSNSSFLEDTHLELGESKQTSHGMLIPEDSLPGLLYGQVEYVWSIEGDERVEKEADVFLATYVENKPYRDLLEDYTRMEANYTDLKKEYQTLANGRTAQDGATGLMYVFFITTAIFVVTTILLLLKRPKAPTW